MSHNKNNPQLEDGYIRIANELLEAILAFGFTQRELLVLLAVLRKTYGYNKKADDMSASQISSLCGVPRQHVTTTLLTLASRNVITKSQGQFGSIIGVQKNHKKWVSQDIFKGRLASPDLGQGCPEAGPGDQHNGNFENFPDDNLKTAVQPAPLLDSSSPISGHPSPESGHVPIWVNASPDLGQVASPDLGHTKDNLPKDNQKTTSSSSGDDVSLCPVGSLVDIFHELMPDNPRVKVVSEPRKKMIRSRWREAAVLDASPFGYKTKSEGIAAWRTFFAYCAQSDFLTGKVPGKDGKKPYRADIEFLFSPGGFAKAVEGKYHPDGAAAGTAGSAADPEAWRKDPMFARGK